MRGELDAHRKRQQALRSGLTLTGMYNVLKKLRAFEVINERPLFKGEGQDDGEIPTTAQTLTVKEKLIHEQGLVSVLKQIHDDLDAVVFHAYGWDDLLEKQNKGASIPEIDELILERLVALNHERAEEEKRGLIRWLRPEFQNPDAEAQPLQTEMPGVEPTSKTARGKTKSKTAKLPWPKTLPEQVAALTIALEAASAPETAGGLAKGFSRANKPRIAEILATLTALGKAMETSAGKYEI